MQNISLNGEWSLCWFDEPQADLPAFLSGPDSQTVIPAQVPGNVELDLHQAGLLPDPYFAANIRLLRALENREWWYKKRFQVPAEFARQRSELVFEGLDTLATVWLNGQEIGRANNMLIPHHFEVTQALRPGTENSLVVRLESAASTASQMQYEPGMMSWEHRAEGLLLRKAPHVWGWDILPRAVSAGIWRPVSLQVIPEHTVESLYCWTVEARPELATLGIWFQVRTSFPIDELHLEVDGRCEGDSFHAEWPLEFTADQFTVPVENPRLWWPAGYGEASLYTVAVRLQRGERILAERSQKVGLRKLEILRTENQSTRFLKPAVVEIPAQIDQPPKADSNFIIYINRQPVMVKGTNWVPLDAFHSRDSRRLDQALEMVADLGCNMIRCWGGNVYESDDFFDWCDAHGVMVWQDFAFACCIYPQEDGFQDIVRNEVQAVVERLRNHPSLAVWCGDNEVDMVYASQGRNPLHNRLTRQTIPRVLQRFDPHRDYLPSSPYISPQGWPHASSDTPEQHLWGPRGFYKGDFYTRHSAHFIGEIGYHGCPEPASLARFLSPENHWPPEENDEWQVHSVYHWRSRTIERDRVALMSRQIQALFGDIPDNLPEYAFASQVAQAEALKFFVESTRLRKWHTSGILWWNLLDGWPQFSDAVVDYYFTRKLAYHFLRRVQRPVLLCLAEKEIDPPTDKAFLPVILSNDSLISENVSYRVWDADSQETLVEGRLLSPANQNWQVSSVLVKPDAPRMFMLEWQVGEENFSNHYLLAEPPLDLEHYRSWLKRIAALPQPFSFWGGDYR